MATSLREFVKVRAVNDIVWFLHALEGTPPTSVLALGAPTTGFEEKPYPAILDYFTLVDSSGTPWHARASAGGILETVRGNVGGLNMAGYGVFGLGLRGATWNTFSYTVSIAGVLSIVNTPAPANDIANPDYVDGTSHVAFCRHHNLAYRPDERIVYRSATHCPVDGARLRSWRDVVRERDRGDDSADAADHERW